jgi:hypothetical protein
MGWSVYPLHHVGSGDTGQPASRAELWAAVLGPRSFNAYLYWVGSLDAGRTGIKYSLSNDYRSAVLVAVVSY